MATIPIEVIIQDAESPVTPTPESGEETNITVPDTGTISDVNNSGGIGSSASIILPAIIVILAIGAIVAMLVHKYHKHQNDKLSKKEKLATVASGTIAILAATVLVGNLVIPATKAATDETNGSADTNEGTYLETEDKVTIVATIDKDSKEPTIVNVKDTLYANTDASGYTVTMSMIEDALTSNLYLNGDESSEYYIAPVEVENEDENENATKGVELATNTWGYRLNEDDSYLPVPVADAPATVAEGETAVTHEEINVYYGLKVDGTLPLGAYSGEIEYNITPVNPIDKLTYMQDFAKLSAEEKTALIAAMPEGKQYTLKDYRDKKPYYISKLADGNVWMTQNLDLDIVAGVAFTSEYTDVSDSWTPTRSTILQDDLSIDTWGTGLFEVNSYDPGDLYYYSASSTSGPDTPYTSLALCQEAHADCSAHNHAGNYYTWPTAVASNDTSEYGDDDRYTNVVGSICPAGWRLPTGRQSDDSGLIGNALGSLLADSNVLGEHDSCGGACYSYTTGGFSAIRTAPLWLMRLGSVITGSVSNAGNEGYYWSSTVNYSSEAYVLKFTKDYVAPADSSGSGGRHTGITVRCLAK